jgi:succinate dehydrogenase/fumarate reductase flavoprotein subunit
VHQYQCLTGLEIQKALHRKIRSNTKIATRTGTLISDLLVDSGRVCGACGVDGHTGELLVIKARAVILAAGGSGRIHSFTTYPNDVTGDGMAMAYRVGLRVRDMELLQFEPCCFVAPSRIRGYVNPTTFLKMGAVLRNGRGDVFINDYSTIQKDELSRKIHKEILEGRGTPAGGVYYDLRMLSEEVVKVTHYVHYQPALVEGGIDICKEVSEVAPAGHSFQGGVITRPDCSTDIEGLFVAGETMGGIHGANRMGGDAGGAALVFGKIAGKTVAAAYRELAPPDSSTVQALADETLGIIRKAQNKRGANPSALKIGIQEMMQTKVGVLKTEECLSAAARELEAFDGELDDLSADSPSAIRDLLSVRNMLLTARMMVFCSRARKESRGVHYRSDYPERNDAEWSGKSVIVSQDNHGKMTTTIQVRK